LLGNIDALILGCTHYPLVKKEISDFYAGRVAVLDSSAVVAKALFDYLDSQDLLRKTNRWAGSFSRIRLHRVV